jgi:peptidoglycan/xylan/chitin deacetylase (PgdA/CDA1 family)
MRRFALILGSLAGGILAGMSAAVAASCPGNPNALGTSRTITVDPATMPRIGNVQYRNTLPLNDHEVVITFDDGPLAPYSNRILDALAAECVKVTYFLVGRMAAANPELVRRIYNSGHTIGTHSQNHPLTFDQMAMPRAEREINAGIASVQAAAGDPRAVAPFFRIPGLLRSQQVEHYLAGKSIAVWSVDAVADDWFKQVTPKDIVQKAISRLDAHEHRGVLLLHDIHPATAMAVPTLLRELKARGYRIVQAVPAGERPKAVPDAPTTVVADGAKNAGWPRVTKTSLTGGNIETTPAHSARDGRKIITERHERRPKHWRDDPVVTSAISRKKQKTKTSDAGFTRFQR